MSRAVFRADASADIGGGHVMRCLTLAGELASFGWTCSFETADGAPQTVPALGRSPFTVETAPDRWGEACDLLIVDHYGLDRGYETQQRERAGRLLVLDDAPGRPHDCDILLDQSPARDASDYAGLTPPTCRLLVGTDFALLRPEFLSERREARTRSDLRSILVSTGASDPCEILGPIMDAIVESNIDARVTVVLTSAMPHLDALRDKAHGNGFDAVIDADDMATLMRTHDMAIGAAGGTSWERCCVGLPAVIFIVAENQRTNASMLEKSGAALSLGAPDGNAFAALVQMLREMSAETVSSMSERAFQLVDGMGTRRVLIALAEPVVLAGGERTTLRCAADHDMDRVFEWQSIPGIRRHFRDPEPPTPDGHKNWFSKAVSDPQQIFCIVETDGSPSGLVRLSPRDEGGLEVSILIAPDSQGKGVAGAALSMIRAVCPGIDLWALVHEDNTASMRLFLSAGYEPVAGEWYVNAAEEPVCR